MALTYLADTSVLTRLAEPAIASVIGSLLRNGAVARCSMTDLEIGYSARNAHEWDALNGALKKFGLVAVASTDFERAAAMQRALAAINLRGRKVPDLLIAAAAERCGLVVLHYDHDFELIGDVTGQKCEWVVPRGSVN